MAALLWILVEGPDDERFMEKLRQQLGFDVRFWQYANEPRARRDNFIRSLNRMRAEYLYVTDLDSRRFPCVRARKERVCEDTQGLDGRRVIVVGSEIEAWYLAGLSEPSAEQLKVKLPRSADMITKEVFDRLRPSRFDSRTDFMVELLKHFDPEVAKARSGSFAYFLRRLAAIPRDR